MRNLTLSFILLVLSILSVQAQDNTHTIQKGETLSSIARKHKTTVQEIIRLNPSAAKGIQAGAVLQLPGAVSELKNTESPKEDGPKTHKVKSGESLSRIASKYKVTVSDLEKWNSVKANSLKAGQEIYVADPGSSAPKAEKEEQVLAASDAGTSDELTHRVAKGETLSQIARKYGTSVEAIRKANDTVYGLAGAVFTSDGAKAQRVIKQLRAGITWINTYHPTFNEAPWGGYKQSGIGRELGTYGLEAYTEVKQININLAPGRIGWFKNI